jgi:hypothetical protein
MTQYDTMKKNSSLRFKSPHKNLGPWTSLTLYIGFKGLLKKYVPVIVRFWAHFFLWTAATQTQGRS